jgi:hypothetical protein
VILGILEFERGGYHSLLYDRQKIDKSSKLVLARDGCAWYPLTKYYLVRETKKKVISAYHVFVKYAS